MDVQGAHIFKVDAVDARRDLHVVAHTGRGCDVVDVLGNLEETAAVAYAELLHGGADRQADGGAAA